jgi:Fur family transcriptional regulator, peroxide stress response regulator
MRSVEALVDLLRQRGLKITPQRRAILELLVGDTSHPTAEEIYRRLRQRMPDISRMTIYNTLHSLVSIGELVEVEGASGEGIRYDTNAAGHDHLFCLRCHAIVDIAQDLACPDIAPPAASGYQIVRRQVTFYGYCPNCWRNEAE